MSDETQRTEDPDERADEMREHHEEVQKRNPDERPPGERAQDQDPATESTLGGVPGSAANRPSG
jgi:hypothetical protein